MKRAILFLVVFIPGVIMAQEMGPSLAQPQTSSADSELSSIITRNIVSIPPRPSDSSSLSLAFGPGAGPAAQQKRSAPPPSKNNQKTERPRTEGSMVGYIDDAIVGSQIRVRFDAGFNNDTPDLAEFFYAKCGCYRGLAGTPLSAAFDPNAPGPPPGSGIVIPRTLNFQQLYLTAEYAPVKRFSVFLTAPFRWLQADGLVAGAAGSFPNQGGFSDLRAGFKAAVLASSSQYLTFQFRAYIPTGDAMKGLGTNHWSIEPSVLYYQRLSKNASLESQFGWWHPTGGSAGVPTSSSDHFWGNVLTYGIGPSYTLYSSDRVRFTPVVELVGWHVTSGFETGPTSVSGTNIVNLKVGARTAWGDHNSLYLGFGHKLTTADWYQDIIRAEYRYTF